MQGVGVDQVAGLAEVGDAEAADAVTTDSGEERRGVRVSVLHGHQGSRGVSGQQLLDDVTARDTGGVAVAALLEGPEHQVGAGQAHHASSHAVLGEHACSFDDFGHEGADADKGDVVLGRGVGGEAVPAGDGLPAAPLEQRRLLWSAGELGVEGTGGESEVRRRAAGDADPAGGVEERPFQVLGEGGLPGDAARLF